MRWILGILLLLGSIGLAAQAKESSSIRFVPVYHNEPVQPGNVYYKINAHDSILFETFRCYISDISFYNGSALVFKEQHSYHLLDMEEPKSMSVNIVGLKGKTFNSIHFTLGIDSATNSSGAHGGDLDPANGMYWSWQSGYINFKLEGKSNLCNTRGHKFQFHLGGYLSPYNAMQHVQVDAKNTEKIVIEINLDQFLQSIDLAKQNQIMIPGKEAVELSKKAAAAFNIKP